MSRKISRESLGEHKQRSMAFLEALYQSQLLYLAPPNVNWHDDRFERTHSISRFVQNVPLDVEKNTRAGSAIFSSRRTIPARN